MKNAAFLNSRFNGLNVDHRMEQTKIPLWSMRRMGNKILGKQGPITVRIEKIRADEENWLTSDFEMHSNDPKVTNG